MFAWYRNSKACFVYLSDVHSDSRTEDLTQFTTSRWFTRGWTLQELLAPRAVRFFNSTWNGLGSKVKLSVAISKATGIEKEFIENADGIHSTTIAQRMSWAAGRKTSRKEDMAYCLLGILDVNMPLLYGEGTRAFKRLQEEIIKNTYDHTILAWGCGSTTGVQELGNGLLATSPDAFRSWKSYPYRYTEGNHYILTNLGLHIELPVVFLDDNPGTALGILDCGKGYKNHVVLPLEYKKRMDGPITMHRARAITPFYADPSAPNPTSVIVPSFVQPASPVSITPSLPFSDAPSSPSSARSVSVFSATNSISTQASTIADHDFCPATSEQSAYRRLPVYLQMGKLVNDRTGFFWSIQCQKFLKDGYFLADCYPPCDIKMLGTALSIYDVECRSRLVRFCPPDGSTNKTILLLIEMSGTVDCLQIAETDSDLNSWQMLLYSDYKRTNFERLRRDFVWEVLKWHREPNGSFYEIV